MRANRRDPAEQSFIRQEDTGLPALSLLPNRERRIAVVKRMIDLRCQGNFRALSSLLTEDCVFRIGGLPKATLISGTWIGRAQVLEGMRANYTLIEIMEVISMEFIVDGDNVVAPWKSRMRNRGTGPSRPISGISYLRFRGDQICEYTTQMDTASVEQITSRLQDVLDAGRKF